MTVKIELPPDVEAGLTAQANEKGLGLSEYVEDLLKSQARLIHEAEPKAAPNRADAWRAISKRFPQTPLLSDQAISRENLYENRG